jgi:hypothetical protein
VAPVLGSTRVILPAAVSVTYSALSGPMVLPEPPCRPLTRRDAVAFPDGCAAMAAVGATSASAAAHTSNPGKILTRFTFPPLLAGPMTPGSRPTPERRHPFPSNRVVRPWPCSCLETSSAPGRAHCADAARSDGVTFARICASDGTHQHAAAEPCRKSPLRAVAPCHPAPQLACVQERCKTYADGMEIFFSGVPARPSVLLPRICQPPHRAGTVRHSKPRTAIASFTGR